MSLWWRHIKAWLYMYPQNMSKERNSVFKVHQLLHFEYQKYITNNRTHIKVWGNCRYCSVKSDLVLKFRIQEWLYYLLLRFYTCVLIKVIRQLKKEFVFLISQRSMTFSMATMVVMWRLGKINVFIYTSNSTINKSNLYH